MSEAADDPAMVDPEKYAAVADNFVHEGVSRQGVAE